MSSMFELALPTQSVQKHVFSRSVTVFSAVRWTAHCLLFLLSSATCSIYTYFSTPFFMLRKQLQSVFRKRFYEYILENFQWASLFVFNFFYYFTVSFSHSYSCKSEVVFVFVLEYFAVVFTSSLPTPQHTTNCLNTSYSTNHPVASYVTTPHCATPPPALPPASLPHPSITSIRTQRKEKCNWFIVLKLVLWKARGGVGEWRVVSCHAWGVGVWWMVKVLVREGEITDGVWRWWAVIDGEDRGVWCLGRVEEGKKKAA